MSQLPFINVTRVRANAVIAAVVMVSGLLGGCSTGNGLKLPSGTTSIIPGMGPAKVGSQANDVANAFRDAPPPPAGESAIWWAKFSDPVLDGLVREALTESLSVQQANQRVLEARSTGRATIAGFAPRVNSSLSTDTNTVLDGPKLVNVTGGTENSQTTQTGVVRTSWEVPLFGRVSSALAGSRAGNAGAQADLEAAKIAVVGDIAASYVDLRNAQLSVAYLQEDLARAERLSAIATARSGAGLISLADASQAQSQVAAVRDRLPDAIIRMRATLDRLAILRGVMPGSLDARLAPVANFAFKSDAPEVNSVPAEFVRRRLDVRRAEQNAILAGAQVGVSRADMYPRVSLSGTITSLVSLAGGAFGADIRRGNTSPAIDIPLFDLGQRRAALKTSESRFQQALLQYRATTLGAVAEGQAALTSYDQARTRAQAGLEGERAAQVRHTATSAAYEAGILSFKERLEAERDLASARQSRLSSQAQYSDAAIGLYRTFAGSPGI
jgi:NodT family efflux transporter outer membrane factor (OMF) lipoprotein